MEELVSQTVYTRTRNSPPFQPSFNYIYSVIAAQRDQCSAPVINNGGVQFAEGARASERRLNRGLWCEYRWQDSCAFSVSWIQIRRKLVSRFTVGGPVEDTRLTTLPAYS